MKFIAQTIAFDEDEHLAAAKVILIVGGVGGLIATKRKLLVGIDVCELQRKSESWSEAARTSMTQTADAS